MTLRNRLRRTVRYIGSRLCLALLMFSILFMSSRLWSDQKDVSSSIRNDKNHQLWVQIHNDGENVIDVYLIVIEFHRSTELIEQQQIRCKENCRVTQDTSKEFGPVSIPKGVTDTKITDVKYSSER